MQRMEHGGRNGKAASTLIRLTRGEERKIIQQSSSLSWLRVTRSWKSWYPIRLLCAKNRRNEREPLFLPAKYFLVLAVKLSRRTLIPKVSINVPTTRLSRVSCRGEIIKSRVRETFKRVIHSAKVGAARVPKTVSLCRVSLVSSRLVSSRGWKVSFN